MLNKSKRWKQKPKHAQKQSTSYPTRSNVVAQTPARTTCTTPISQSRALDHPSHTYTCTTQSSDMEIKEEKESRGVDEFDTMQLKIILNTYGQIYETYFCEMVSIENDYEYLHMNRDRLASLIVKIKNASTPIIMRQKAIELFTQEDMEPPAEKDIDDSVREQLCTCASFDEITEKAAKGNWSEWNCVNHHISFNTLM